ncbi:carbohydrate ABC transporter permease [Longirhabdus pacifica]|uniref:carbohydrate ABC transporter permease n=1 Tax=Longirhabdus pacifica TaxID=2305227 RepID=UPI0027B8FA0E|nr:sugar ABC transporter permease [Longirhabdus pacifica]
MSDFEEKGLAKVANFAKKAAVLSTLCMGLGQWYNRQFVKGALFLTAEIVFVYLLITSFIDNLIGLITLGDKGATLEKVGRKFVNVPGDNSIDMLLDGLASVLVILVIIFIYVMNVRDAYRTGKAREAGEKPLSFTQSWKKMNTYSFPYMMLTIPFIGVLIFTIFPILFTVLIAFTNYSAPNYIPPKGLVDWVGFETFIDLFALKQWSYTFFTLLTWTAIWAVSATVTTYFGGILVALLIQQKGIKLKRFWRTLFILPYAIPQFISLLIFRNLLNDEFGAINGMLRQIGLEGVKWLNDPIMAKFSIIFVNMWVGIPVSMLLVIGLLGNIPKDLYEAADVDGATNGQKFRSITMPYILFATAPVLIINFVGNINNFNVIYLLTNGDPKSGDLQYAGTTDLLVTWLYKLTLDNQQYSFASAIAVLMFIFIAIMAIIMFRNTPSFKEEDMVQ